MALRRAHESLIGRFIVPAGKLSASICAPGQSTCGSLSKAGAGGVKATPSSPSNRSPRTEPSARGGDEQVDSAPPTRGLSFFTAAIVSSGDNAPSISLRQRDGSSAACGPADARRAETASVAGLLNDFKSALALAR
jgi:hypothetical protein